MSEWTQTAERPGYRSKTVQLGAATIIIHRPILTQQETESREKQVKALLVASMKDCIHRTPELQRSF